VVPGDTPAFTVVITNNGPGIVTGVTVEVDLPANFRFKSTGSVSGDASARTSPIDPAVNTRSPVFGIWSLDAPGVNADASVRRAHADITFTATASGLPGAYPIQAKVNSDTTDQQFTSKPVQITLQPAPELQMQVAAAPTQVKNGGEVQYQVTVTNNGSGAATDIGLAASLPSGFSWERTDSISGNAASGRRVDPFPNASVPYYGGWDIPGRTSGGPGIIVISFHALVAKGTVAGNFTVSVQLTDAGGDLVIVKSSAPVAVS
jgi:uncharacterized repeat protein (TIGR01451 family)